MYLGRNCSWVPLAMFGSLQIQPSPLLFLAPKTLAGEMFAPQPQKFHTER